jgi:DNA polymerase-3 subunit epsilon
VELTGITDEMVGGRKIDDARVRALSDSAAIVIAHNAAFDRKFAEARWPFFEDKAWGCSMQDIPWRKEGLEASKLEYLAYRFGFFYEGHRAVSDCLAGIELLSRHLPRSGAPAMRVLLNQARKSSYRIFAENTPFDTKDTLRGRGYRWNNGSNGQPRCWYKDVVCERLDEELSYLKSAIYQNPGDEPSTKKITAFQRYSARV